MGQRTNPLSRESAARRVGASGKVRAAVLLQGHARSAGDDAASGVRVRATQAAARTVGEMGVIAEERELAGLVRGNQLLQHEAPEQLGEHQHRQEEVGTGGDPALPVRRQTAARYNHVHVRVMHHGRAPGVQHRGDGDPGTEMLRVGCNRKHGLGRGLEQQVVDHRLVGVGDVADGCRQREDDVEVGHGQQLGFPLFHPRARRRPLALRAMPIAATVVGDDRVGAVLATRDVAWRIVQLPRKVRVLGDAPT